MVNLLSESMECGSSRLKKVLHFRKMYLQQFIGNSFGCYRVLLSLSINQLLS